MHDKPRRIVIKLGTGIITQGVGKIDPLQIAGICSQVAEIQKRGIEVILVSSGAIGMGMGVLGMDSRPQTLAKQQACASIGQSRLIQCWQDGLAPYDIIVGQILLTHEGLSVRNRYVNAKATIEQMLAYGVVPIINENDAISNYEIRFGNNDLLGAMVASFSEADHLYILSTAPGLIDMDGTGEIVPIVEKITPRIAAMAKGTNSPTAVGGMVSKIDAAMLATESGCATYIADGSEQNVVLRILDGEQIGTLFKPAATPIASKKRWLTYFQRPNGSVVIDQGACTALAERGRSLLAPGVLRVEGIFESGEVIDIISTDGTIIGRGQTAFSSVEIEEIISKRSPDVEKLHPDRNRLEIIHRDEMAIL
ncbi:glutamate 5-kinase [Pelagicoccus sp. SDUM812003]|uniref:glutamate 5-kinase n=1 Tax=Pelagicoccus sp. SDUM812003 TaxID=3041267 RepID=UPI00280DA55A|nr:glutamate 5-kinase [Pelagicoccus sp. SDUM812003]MDQ8205694.1 glutamate 5-kinase [Pelagicoccus sp. SDUM812003]